MKFKAIPLALVLVASLTLQFCSSSKKSAITQNEQAAQKLISYESEIKPIMVRSCTPCHFPEEGKKKMLNTYESTKDNIEDILHRVQLPVDDKHYMPFKSKKPALAASEIELMKQWVAQNMPK